MYDNMILWPDGKGDWFVPMVHDASETIKSVPLSMFAEEGVREANDLRISDLVETVRSVLNEGIYRADYDVSLATVATDVAETEGVQLCYSGQEVGRVYTGNLKSIHG
jgi:hypothetical protein